MFYERNNANITCEVTLLTDGSKKADEERARARHVGGDVPVTPPTYLHLGTIAMYFSLHEELIHSVTKH